MAGHTYVTKGYSPYTDISAQDGAYAYGPRQPANSWYMVETTTIERVRVPGGRYTNFGGPPSKKGFYMEYMPGYAPNDHYGSYQPNYGSDDENSSLPRYHDGESLMNEFLNKIQIGASRPTKVSNFSSPNKYRPTSPNKYRPTSPNKYRSANPNEYQPTSPNRYRPSSPNKYRPTSPYKYRPTSPNKYRPTSPNKYHPSSPNTYRPMSPTRSYPSKEAHPIKTPNLPGPNKYQSSPVHDNPSEEAHLTKAKNLTGPNNDQPNSPMHNSPSEEGYLTRAKNFLGPKKYQPTSQGHIYPSEEGYLTRAKTLVGPTKYQPSSPESHLTVKTPSLSSPNQHHPSSPSSEGGQHVTAGKIPGPNNNSQNAGPPAMHRPMTNPTNNMDEALGFLAESVNYSPRSDPKRTGVFDNMSPRAQPIEPKKRYTRSGFFRSNTIDSQEARRKYNGAFVP